MHLLLGTVAESSDGSEVEVSKRFLSADERAKERKKAQMQRASRG